MYSAYVSADRNAAYVIFRVHVRRNSEKDTRNFFERVVVDDFEGARRQDARQLRNTQHLFNGAKHLSAIVYTRHTLTNNK